MPLSHRRIAITVLPFILAFATMIAAADDTAHEAIRRAGPLTPACSAAKRYLDLLNQQRSKEIADLFAEDTQYTGPDGKELHHPSDIAAGYARIFGSFKLTKAKIISLVPVRGSECLLEFSMLDRDSNQYIPSAVDHFFVDHDGKVERFLPYFQSKVIPALVPRLFQKTP